MTTAPFPNPESVVARMIAELEADPRLKPLLLRSLLTDEFLLLPSKVDRLMDLVPVVAQLQQDVAVLMELPPKVEQLMELPPKVDQLMELPAKVERLEEDVATLMELPAKVEQLMELVPKVEQLMELPAKFDRLEGKLNNVIGDDYERRVARNSPNIARRYLRLRHARVLQAINRPDNESVPDLANAAAEQGRLTDDDVWNLLLTDLILLDRNTHPEPVYVVVEVSHTLDGRDVIRAAERARILRQATDGSDTIAAVIGTAISEGSRRQADNDGVIVITISDPPA